jgi:hypothetical protein
VNRRHVSERMSAAGQYVSLGRYFAALHGVDSAFHKRTAGAGPFTRRHTLIPNLSGRARLAGWNLISGNKQRVRSQLSDFGLSSASLATRKRSPRKEVSRLEEFLICKNRKCRFLVSLRADNKLLSRAELIFSACPECNDEWSGRCPFCVQTLDVTWQSEIPSCSHCRRPLKPDVDVDNGTRRQ